MHRYCGQGIQDINLTVSYALVTIATNYHVVLLRIVLKCYYIYFILYIKQQRNNRNTCRVDMVITMAWATRINASYASLKTQLGMTTHD